MNRTITAELLAATIMNPEKNPEAHKKHATLVGHSHGGNVIKEAEKILTKAGWSVDIINMGTPQREDHQSSGSNDGLYLNFYNDNDAVQWYGTDDNYIWRDEGNVGAEGPRIDPNADQNVEIETGDSWIGNNAGHSFHQDKKAQDKIIQTVENAKGL